MADRILRDELLTSERYWSVSIEAQRLFIHLLLVVDDTARFSGKNFTIRSACFPGQAMDPAKVEKLLEELLAVDLVRMWNTKDERFLFIPRFKQRLRYPHSKFPCPPKEINDVPERKSDSSQSEDRPQSDSSQAQDGPKSAEVKRSEAKRSDTSPPSPPPGGGAAKAAKPKTGGSWWETDWGVIMKGRELGMEARVGEQMPEFKARVRAEINRRKEAKKL